MVGWRAAIAGNLPQGLCAVCIKWIGRSGAFASKLCSYEEQKQNAHRFCFSPLNTMSASSGELLILIHGRRRKAEWRD